MKSKSVLPLSIHTKDTSTQCGRFWLNQSVRNALEGKALVIWSWLVLCEGKRASSLTTNHWHHCVPLGHLLCARNFGFFAPNMTDHLSSGVNQKQLVSACGLSILALDMHPKTGVSSVRSMTPKSGNVLGRHSMSGSQKRWDVMRCLGVPNDTQLSWYDVSFEEGLLKTLIPPECFNDLSHSCRKYTTCSAFERNCSYDESTTI